MGLFETFDGCLYLWNLLFAGIAIAGLGRGASWLVREEGPRRRFQVAALGVVLLASSPFLLLVASLSNRGALPISRYWAFASPQNEKRPPSNSDGKEATARTVQGSPSDVEVSVTIGADVPKNAKSRIVTVLVGVVWFAGSLFCLLRWAKGYIHCMRLRRRATPVDEPRLLVQARRACDAAQLDVVANLATSEFASGPMTLGVWRPWILLPNLSSKVLADEELLFVLTHEAAHIARRDAFLALFQQWVRCLYWWNPLLAGVHREMERSREQACDDYVLRGCSIGNDVARSRSGLAEGYAGALLKLAEWSLGRGSHRTTFAMHLQDGNELSDRVVRLLEGGKEMSSSWNCRTACGLIALGGCMIAFTFVPVLKVFAQEREPQKKPPANRLSFNDGSAEGKRSIAGASEFVSFSLPAEDKEVVAIRVHGSRYGSPQAPKENFMIYFLDKDLTETVDIKMAPYSRFERGDAKWVEIKFPKPVKVPKEFWVGVDFRAEQRKGVYVSIDNSTDGSRSRVGIPGQEIKPANVDGDWMFEVVLTK